MRSTFHIGISPDFYTDALGHFERVLEQQFGLDPHVVIGPMPPQPGNVATPDALQQFDGILSLALRFTAESVRGVDRLAIVARWGVGYDMIDVDALTQADIALCITPGGVRRPVAEAILTLIFALTKNLFRLDRITRAGLWRTGLNGVGGDIAGRVLGSLGCGNIASELFRLARPLGFGRLIACDPFVEQKEMHKLGVELVDLDALFRESDFVTVNVPLDQHTRGLIDERLFRLMKLIAFFINTARGPIVRHEALVKALQERWISGAGIDVFPVEPPPEDDPLFRMDNVIVTPHALAWTEGSRQGISREACSHLLAVSRGELPGGIVNRDVINRPGFRKKLESYR